MASYSHKRSGASGDYIYDPEKARRYSCSSCESSDYESQSSRDGYASPDPMLSRKPSISNRASFRRSARSAISNRVPQRIVRWLCIALMSSLIIFILSLWRMSMMSAKHVEQAMKERPRQPHLWEGFGFLERYYGGLRTLEPREANVPEYPIEGGLVDANRVYGQAKKDRPTSLVVAVYPDYEGEDYRREFGVVKECLLYEDEETRIPKVRGYNGTTEGFPENIVGSYSVIGLDNNICYDRYGRLGPYGYGYSAKRGGSGTGMIGDRNGADEVWKEVGRVYYAGLKWAEAQDNCVRKNLHRFVRPDSRAEIEEASTTQFQKRHDNVSSNEGTSVTPKKQIARTAIVIRTWMGFDYTPETLVHLRSLIAELSLLSSGEYTVHFLVHVKDHGIPIWGDEGVYNETLKQALPPEFEGMGTLWSEQQMSLIYPGLQDSFFEGLPVHGVYRSAHFALQWFAHKHPEYEHFWNMEMDIRYTGQWYSLLSSLSTFAQKQPRKGLWERNERFYIPSVHGSWEDFHHTARVQSEMPPPQANNKWAAAGPPDAEAPPASASQPVWGPVPAPDTPALDEDVQAPSPSSSGDDYAWGVGEEADLIALNPIFDPARTRWPLGEDVTGYNTSAGLPPRRAAIVTTARLSRRLLAAMHQETALHRHSMASEMFPATVALHHGLKAVYAPHPVFVDRAWPAAYLAQVFNGGLNGAAGGSRTSVFGEGLRHNLRGVSWFYDAGFPQNLWRRWLGERVDGGGGPKAELAEDGEGRMCLPPMLLHPVKEVVLPLEGAAEGEGEG